MASSKRPRAPEPPSRWAPRDVDPLQAQRDAGSELLKMLLSLYATTKINAYDLSVLCGYCAKAGVPGGAFSRYARDPGKQSGAYQHFLDTKLPGPGPLYYVPTPCNVKRSPKREIKHIPFRPIFETIADELQTDDTSLHLVGQDPDDREQTVLDLPCYLNHPHVVQAVDEGRLKPVPLGVYMDGVRYTSTVGGRADSVLGFWVINLLTGKRHVAGVLLGSDKCLCGCKGWCTFHPPMHAISWMLKSLVDGHTPAHRHDGSDWALDDPLGKRKEFPRCCVLWSSSGFAAMHPG
eukprot:8034680-Pyramimonas_sp.AAC.1